MQSHKQVREWRYYYDGHIFDESQGSTWNLYEYKGQWYISAQRVTLQKNYPLIHDSILFTEDNEAHFDIVSRNQTERVFHPISKGTALVLLREDGYARWDDLAEEITSHSSSWIPSLPPGFTTHPVRAQVVPSSSPHGTIVAGNPRLPKTPLSNQILGGLDFVIVDIPGTLVYNLLIPVMAPIKFFAEFSLSD